MDRHKRGRSGFNAGMTFHMRGFSNIVMQPNHLQSLLKTAVPGPQIYWSRNFRDHHRVSVSHTRSRTTVLNFQSLKYSSRDWKVMGQGYLGKKMFICSLQTKAGLKISMILSDQFQDWFIYFVLYYLENVTFPFYQVLLWGWDVYLSRGTETEL